MVPIALVCLLPQLLLDAERSTSATPEAARTAGALVAPSVVRTECGAFVASPREPGIWKRLDDARSKDDQREGNGEGGIAGSDCGPIVTGLEDPGPVWRDGNRLYVGNNANNTAKKVTVVDVTTPGGEFVVETIATPVNPVDVAVALGRLYVIDQNRNKLYSRPLAGGAWSFIPVPAGTITEWDYGHIIEPFGDRMYVIHQWENTISVVNLGTESVESTITNLDHLPDRIVFVNENGQDRMVVLGVGLDAPSCFASGPNFSVFTLPDHTKLYRKDIAGTCSYEVLARDGSVWIAAENRMRQYALTNGAVITQLSVPGIGTNALHRGSDIIAQRSGGEITRVETDLSAFAPLCDLVTGQQVWFPPIEQMAAMLESDGRIFVTNRNNNTLDRVTLAAPCPADLDGDGTVGASDLAVLLGAWNGAGTGDLDGNGTVDAADLAALLGAWGDC